MTEESDREPIVGSDGQETIIKGLAERANECFPQIGFYPYKGLIRVAIRHAMNHSPFHALKELALRRIEERVHFFHLMLDEAEPIMLDQGLLEEDVVILKEELGLRFEQLLHEEKEDKNEDSYTDR